MHDGKCLNYVSFAVSIAAALPLETVRAELDQNADRFPIVYDVADSAVAVAKSEDRQLLLEDRDLLRGRSEGRWRLENPSAISEI